MPSGTMYYCPSTGHLLIRMPPWGSPERDDFFHRLHRAHPRLRWNSGPLLAWQPPADNDIICVDHSVWSGIWTYDRGYTGPATDYRYTPGVYDIITECTTEEGEMPTEQNKGIVAVCLPGAELLHVLTELAGDSWLLPSGRSPAYVADKAERWLRDHPESDRYMTVRLYYGSRGSRMVEVGPGITTGFSGVPHVTARTLLTTVLHPNDY